MTIWQKICVAQAAYGIFAGVPQLMISVPTGCVIIGLSISLLIAVTEPKTAFEYRTKP